VSSTTKRLFILHVQKIGAKTAPKMKEWLGLYCLKNKGDLLWLCIFLILYSPILLSDVIMADANNRRDACNLFTLCGGWIPKLAREKVPNRSPCVLDASHSDLVPGVIDPRHHFTTSSLVDRLRVQVVIIQ
jgi:hypothetical protein